MQKDIKTLFKTLPVNTDAGLADDIWRQISMRQANSRKRALYTYTTLSVLSITGLLLALKELITEFSQSGFADYLSAAMSDGGLALSYWKELLLSLADSLPVMSLLISFSLLFVLFVSVKRASHQFKSTLTLA